MSEKILTQSLLASSCQANWSGGFLEHHLYPAYETPEHILENHHICLYLGKPLTYEQVIKGKLRSQTCIYGDMVIYPAGLTQKLSWNKEAEIIELNIKPELITQAGQCLSSSNNIEIIPQYGLRDPLIQQLTLTLLAELKYGNLYGDLYTDSLFNTLCIHLLKRYSTFGITIEKSNGGLPPFLLRRLDEYIQANLSQNIALADMAEIVNSSTSHLTKLFKQSQGMSLYQYVIRCRIERAKQLLKHQEATIAEVATQVGFADQSHLTYHFKGHVGVTPKAFRRL